VARIVYFKMAPQFSQDQIATVGKLLNDPNRPLKERFRALFTLKNVGGSCAIEWISKAFKDESNLLKHELAYCLGQMQDLSAIPKLTEILKNKNEAAIVRHEAAEAIGALGSEDSLDLLTKYCTDDSVEVAETCKMAITRIKWAKQSENSDLGKNPYNSVDPAPASSETDVSKLREVLLNEDLDMFERYRAMFSLRNKGDQESVKVLGEGLKCSSALFRHEVAFVLGQLESPHATAELVSCLRDEGESAMVRHECAEALGSISGEDVKKELNRFLGEDQPRVVRESCEVALDMADYGDSQQFQYADALGDAAPVR